MLDIVRLTLDEHTGSAARAQLDGAAIQLRADAALHVERWFVENSERSLRLIRTTPDGSTMTADTVALVGELLLGALVDG